MKRLKKKDLLLHANKLIEKTPDPRNVKEHCQLGIAYAKGCHRYL